MLSASAPTTSGNSVHGPGSRTGCGGTVTLTAQVRAPRLADKAVAEAGRNGFGNGCPRAGGTRDGNGTYFTGARGSSGNELSSGRVGRC
ncbi:hypothetical protein ABZ512_17920 [Nocardiopsis dassonvillei]|uniref:hypothetical protein n=1 Tax=Nocardiopsis dassonvillei TaxID=2014 RepID=UPI0033EA5FDC